MRSPPVCSRLISLHQPQKITKMSQTNKLKNAQPTFLRHASFPAPNHKPPNQKMRSPPVCSRLISLHQPQKITKMSQTNKSKNAQPTFLRHASFPAPNYKPPNHKNAQPTKSKECAAYLSAAALSPCTK
jgi:hypothetical protein